MKRTKILFVLLALFFSFSLTAQNQDLKKANKLYQLKKYGEAIPLYQTGIMESKSISARSKLAYCFRMTNQMLKAERLYAEVVLSDRANPKTYFYYGQALMSNGKYMEAKKWFSKFLEKKPDDEQGLSLLRACDEVQNIQPFFEEVKIVDFPHNTDSDDTAPVLFQNNIIFSSDRSLGVKLLKEKSGWTGRDYINLYISKLKEDGTYSEAKPYSKKFNELNKNTGMASFTADGSKAYFTRNGVIANKSDAYPMQLYSAESTDGKHWKKVKLISFCRPTTNYMHPAISPNGKLLYFISNKGGGEGGMDIYVSTKGKKGWNRPQNLGDKINTSGHEGFPFAPSDTSLYFCSKGHTGFGGFDIFYTEKDKEGNWSNPINIGRPINSSYDDISIFVMEGKNMGLFTSSRNGGDDDIYCFQIGLENDESPLFIASSKIDTNSINVNLDAKPIVDSNIIKKTSSVKQSPTEDTYITDLRGTSIPEEEVVLVNEKVKSKKEVVIKDSIEINAESKLENILVDSTNVIDEKNNNKTTNTADVQITFDKEKEIDQAAKEMIQNDQIQIVNIKPNPVYLIRPLHEIESLLENKKMKEGEVFKMPNIHYGQDEFKVTPPISKELDKLILILNKYSALEVEIAEHTESIGDDDVNFKLSYQRADAVLDYLVNKGIEKSRIKAKGYGETSLVNHCVNDASCTFSEHMLNQRLEVRVLKY